MDSWDRYLDSVKAARTTPEQKKRLAEAVRILRRVLGEDWPSKSKDSYHTILLSLRSISGAASDSLLVYWADCVSALEGAEGFGGMAAKLRRTDGLPGTIAELEVAGRLVARGCTVELEPEVGRKKPDMRCRYDDLEFLVEVKTLATADKSQNAFTTFTAIYGACLPIRPVGVIFETLDKPRLDEVVGIVEREAKRAVSSKQAVEVHLDEVLKMYLVPDGLPDGTEMCAEWCRKQEAAGVMLRDGGGTHCPSNGGWLYGPSDGVIEEYRIKSRINDFSGKHQIPPGHVGVLVMTGHFSFWDVDSAGRFVYNLIEDVNELANIPAVVLVSSKAIQDIQETRRVDKENFIYIHNRVHDCVGRHIVIVKNRPCKSGLDYERLASLLTVTK